MTFDLQILPSFPWERRLITGRVEGRGLTETKWTSVPPFLLNQWQYVGRRFISVFSLPPRRVTPGVKTVVPTQINGPSDPGYVQGLSTLKTVRIH